jgi:hypothetical protein
MNTIHSFFFNFLFQANDYLPGIKEKLFVFGEEVWRQGESAVTWTREHGLCCIESTAKAAGRYAVNAALAMAQCCQDIYE